MLSRQLVETVFLSISGNTGEQRLLNLTSGEVMYKLRPISQSFSSILIDNVGEGICKISLSPHINFEGVEGYKTLFPKDVFYAQSTITFVEIYFVQSTVCEIVLGVDLYAC
jgi:hypothetical protein